MVDHTARTGFERGADTYRSVRPAYHPQIVAEVVRRCADRPLVELGAGTGILTAELVARGLHVVAVEPVAAMRRALADHVPDADVRDGTAESVPVPDGGAGAVLAAQAFHWFDAGPALDEIVRVLRPDGLLLTAWNVRDESVDWVARYSEAVDRWAGQTPRHRTQRWRRAIEQDGRFALDDERHVPNPRPADADAVVRRALSTSFVAALPAADQAVVEQDVRQVVSGLGERFTYPYRSELQVWRLVGAA